jgi:hypothetical protein
MLGAQDAVLVVFSNKCRTAERISVGPQSRSVLRNMGVRTRRRGTEDPDNRRSRCLIYTASSAGFHGTAQSIISNISRAPTLKILRTPITPPLLFVLFSDRSGFDVDR